VKSFVKCLAYDGTGEVCASCAAKARSFVSCFKLA
jgi:hypothetical protein